MARTEVTRSGQGAARGPEESRKWPELARSGQGVARGGQKQSQDKDTLHKGSQGLDKKVAG